jgi:DNA primase
VLYGIFHAKQAIAKQDNCYLVEGYTDVIQMHQAGIENVVSSSGTALTPNQIRLINRLTKNVTVLFDGDAAGLRASLRGIDLILEEGMNVKVCTFPDGDDPDSFAKKTPFDDLVAYLDENAMDFIQFKASLLMKEAKNDPIKKADLIRDMVTSISKIPDRIKKEIYIQECARIMDISEEVLFSTLAQMAQKDLSEANKKYKQEQKAFEVVKTENDAVFSKVDILTLLEKTILEILLLYGHHEVEFENVFIQFDDKGKEIETVEKVNQKIYERIYLSLQEDEIELANPLFNTVYLGLIAQYNQNHEFDKNQYVNNLQTEQASIVTNILMNDEKYQLHGWLDKKQVFVKEKDDFEILSRLVSETIITFREFLITQVNKELILQLHDENPTFSPQEIIVMINDYNKLKVNITRKIGRMRSDYN